MARCFDASRIAPTVAANLHRPRAAFHTPSAATRHLPRFAEKESVADRLQLDGLHECVARRERGRRLIRNRNCQDATEAAILVRRMPSRLGNASGGSDDERQALSVERLVSRRLGERGRPRLDGPNDLRKGHRSLPPHRRRGRCARGRVLASAAAAVAGQARRRSDRVRIPRPRVQFGRPLHAYAGAEDDQPVRLRARLSDRRKTSSRLAVAGRSGARRSRAHAGFPLERRRRVEGRGRHVRQPQMRLAPGRRQSDGPDPRDLCAFGQHRSRRDPRHPVRRHPRRPQRDDDPLDDRHRAAAVLGAGNWASPARSTAGRS